MDKKIAYFIGAGILFIFICNCADVPLSFSTKVNDGRIIGYWLNPEKDGGLEIKRNINGNVSLAVYEYNEQSETYETDGETYLLYFTTIADDIGSLNFLSFLDDSKGSEKYYESARFSFSSKGELELHTFDCDYLEKYKKSKDGMVIFSSTKRYVDFIKPHMRESGLYESTYTWQRFNFLKVEKPVPPKPKIDDELTEKKGVEIPDPTEANAWSKAEKIDAARAYREYLQKHPDGPHAAEAQKQVAKIEDIDTKAWLQVMEEANFNDKDTEKKCAAYRSYAEGPFLLAGDPVKQTYLSAHKSKAEELMKKNGCQRFDIPIDTMTAPVDTKDTTSVSEAQPATGEGPTNGLLWVGIIAVLIVMGFLIWGQSKK